MTDIDELIRRERLTFIAILEDLTPEQWEKQSLCDLWTVQDVSAHIAWTPPARLNALPMFVKAGFRKDKFIADSAIAWSARGQAAILDQLRANAASGVTPMLMPLEAAVADAIVHCLDVTVPLGIPRPVAEEPFRVAADWLLGARWPITSLIGGSVSKRLSDVRLVATDVDWSWGEGREVRGRSDELLLRLTGRL